jgi:hypothetical protein
VEQPLSTVVVRDVVFIRSDESGGGCGGRRLKKKQWLSKQFCKHVTCTPSGIQTLYQNNDKVNFRVLVYGPTLKQLLKSAAWFCRCLHIPSNASFASRVRRPHLPTTFSTEKYNICSFSPRRFKNLFIAMYHLVVLFHSVSIALNVCVVSYTLLWCCGPAKCVTPVAPFRIQMTNRLRKYNNLLASVTLINL